MTALRTVTGNTVRRASSLGQPRGDFAVTEFAPGSEESRSVRAAIERSPLNFTVATRPVFIEDPESLGGIRQLENHRSVYRTDTGHNFGVLGNSYTVVQQLEGLNWVQPLIDAGEATIVRAGYGDGGAKVFVTAEIAGSRVEVAKGDTIRLLATFANSHDGSMCASARISAERLVCNNGMAMIAALKSVRARHTKGVMLQLGRAQVELEKARDELRGLATRSEPLTRRRLSRNNLVRYVRETLSPGAGNDESIVVRNVDRIVELATEAPGAQPGTLWGGVNAVTYWATHERGRSENARATQNMFGPGQQLIERAFDVAFRSAEHLPMLELARESYANHATAAAELGALLGRPARIASELDG